MPKLDFSMVEEFVPVPVGRYLAEVASSKDGIGNTSGQRKWTLQLSVLQDPVHEDEFKDKTIKWDISLQPQARWKVLQTLNALGDAVTKEDTEFDLDPANYEGRKCVLIVGEQNDPVYGKRTVVSRLEPEGAWNPQALVEA